MKNKVGGLIVSDLNSRFTQKLQQSRHYGIDKRWMYRSVEKNNKFRNGPTHIRLVDFQQKCHNNSIEKDNIFQQMVLCHLDIHTEKSEVELRPHIIL